MTGSVRIGGYTLRLGDPAGTAIEAAPDGAGGDATVLAEALEAPTEEAPRSVADVAVDTVDDASAVTAKAERAIALSEGVADGSALDPDQLMLEADSLLSLLERLDREGRWEEQLRLARALSNLLSLLKRWAALLRTLRSALRAGEKLGDFAGIGWAKHELGTLRIAAEDSRGAERDLREAAQLRERIGDRRGLALTNRNLGTLCEQLRRLLREDKLEQREQRIPRRLAVIAVAALALGFVVGGAIGAGLQSATNKTVVERETTDGSSSAAGAERAGAEDTGGTSGTGAASDVIDETGKGPPATSGTEPTGVVVKPSTVTAEATGPETSEPKVERE